MIPVPTHDPTRPRALVTVLSCWIVAFALTWTTSAQTHVWTKAHGGPLADYGRSAVADFFGNIYVTGNFSGTVDFGGGPLTSAGVGDIYLAKFDAAGNHLWSRRFGDVGEDIGYAVIVDSSGDVVIAGNIVGSVDFGGGPIVGGGIEDLFLAKFNATGGHVWSYAFPGESGARDIVSDSFDNIYLTGSFRGSLNLGGGTLFSAGLDDIYLAKFDTNGGHVWSQSFGASNTDVGYGLALDSSENVVLAAVMEGSVDFGGGAVTGNGSLDIALAKFSSGGAHLWSRVFGGTLADRPSGVDCDTLYNVLLTGYFQGTAEFGGVPLVSNGGDDFVLAKYDPSGAYLWSRSAGDIGSDRGYAVASDVVGNAIVTGNYQGNPDLGGGPLVFAGLTDGFLAKYDPDGNFVWDWNFGDTGSDGGLNVSVDGVGNILATGYFSGTVSLGGAPVTSVGSLDLYVARYSVDPEPPAITSIVDVENDQGRAVRLSFVRSNVDSPAAVNPVLQYEAYRRIDPLPAKPSSESSKLGGWDYVGLVPSSGEDLNSLIVPTLADSTISDGMHMSVFFLRARTASHFVYYDSPPDSGYSLDNLAPGIPQNFQAVAVDRIGWDPATDADFNYFTLYGSDSAVFDGSAQLIAYTVATDHDILGLGYSYYHLTTTDFAGNESGAATVASPLTSAPMALPTKLRVRAAPNPFNPTTVLTYRVPRSGVVSLSVFDLKGRRVDRLLDEVFHERGEFEMVYRPNLPSGVYLLRVSMNGIQDAGRIVLLK